MRLCAQAFVGLSTGGMLVHVSGRVQHLRPSDGGAVTVEDIRYAEGRNLGVPSPDKRLEALSRSASSSAASQLLKVVVEKDGHRFCTHVHHHAADRLKPESPEHQSGGRTKDEAGSQRASTVSSLSFLLLLRASDQTRREAGLLHSAAAQRSQDVLQLLRADRRSSRSAAPARRLTHVQSLPNLIFLKQRWCEPSSRGRSRNS